MTAEEFGALLYDLLTEATHVVDTVWIKETASGPVLVVGLKTGDIHQVFVSAPPQE